jgi:hypothetical protein
MQMDSLRTHCFKTAPQCDRKHPITLVIRITFCECIEPVVYCLHGAVSAWCRVSQGGLGCAVEYFVRSGRPPRRVFPVVEHEGAVMKAPEISRRKITMNRAPMGRNVGGAFIGPEEVLDFRGDLRDRCVNGRAVDIGRQR